ncbi:MAG: nicotinate-nucleotide adenylyltransferase [Ignavibacteria bacterium]
MRRIGIFGGTFNPPHIAHSIVATNVMEQVSLDKILIIPSAIPPLKDTSDVVAAFHRYNMCKLAFGLDQHFEVSDIEIKQKSTVSYTVDTLSKLRDSYGPNAVKFYLIIGIDQLLALDRWKTPEKLFALSEVVVINRPGFFIHNAEKKYLERVKLLSVPNIDISSTMIREYLKKGRSIKYLVLPEVEKYIHENKLYVTTK